MGSFLCIEPSAFPICFCSTNHLENDSPTWPLLISWGVPLYHCWGRWGKEGVSKCLRGPLLCSAAKLKPSPGCEDLIHWLWTYLLTSASPGSSGMVGALVGAPWWLAADPAKLSSFASFPLSTAANRSVRPSFARHSFGSAGSTSPRCVSWWSVPWYCSGG